MKTLQDRAAEISKAVIEAEAAFFEGIDPQRRIVTAIYMKDETPDSTGADTYLVVQKYQPPGMPTAERTWGLAIWRPWRPASSLPLNACGLNVRVDFVCQMRSLRHSYLAEIERLEAIAARAWP